MQLDVVNSKNEKVGAFEVSDEVFGGRVNTDLIWESVVRENAAKRQGTHATKNRAIVSGGGKKPWKQKGTGRARQGSTRAPQWRGGGKVHTPKPRDYTQAMPRQMRRGALRSALSVKAADGQIVVVEDLNLDSVKTQSLAAILTGLVGEGQKTLVLLGARNENVERSLGNLTSAKYLRAAYLNIRDLLSCDKVILPLGALEIIQGYLG